MERNYTILDRKVHFFFKMSLIQFKHLNVFFQQGCFWRLYDESVWSDFDGILVFYNR